MGNYTIIETQKINKQTKDCIIDLTLETITKNKQVLIFNNSKRSSETVAVKIFESIKNIKNKEELKKISKDILSTLSNPTKQCIKLSKCVEKGVAFHHSGLLGKQRSIIEKNFKNGLIKVISSTPTLAAGLNLPAYQVIIKDYKRYSQRGFNDIPILEYHQMAGRAGRPGKEEIGKTILCVGNENEKDRIIPKYIFGKPEEIISKLAVEPTLKMYLLSLISMDLINTKTEISEFFKNTLYAQQYKDLTGLENNIFRILDILIEYDFIQEEDHYFVATKMGKKISELYLNPDTANYFINNINKFINNYKKNENSKNNLYSLIHFIVNTLEMRPLFNIKKIEEEEYSNKLEKIEPILEIKYDPFEDDYQTYLSTIKTTEIFMDWISEAPENYISEKYKITPGELHYKLETLDWLLYSLEEITIMKKKIYFKNILNKIRTQFKYGIKKELLPFIHLKGIGRVKARKLYDNNFKNLLDLKMASYEKLSSIIGDSLTIKITKELNSNENFSNEYIERKKEKPKEIKIRDIQDEEIEELVTNYNIFEKEKQEKNKKLLDYF